MAYKKQKNVNIDALIAREDFEAADETTNTASKISTLSVNDLKEGSGLFLASVRKPDFQRETADWENDIAVQRIIDTYRRGLQSARHISDYYVCVLNLFASGKTSVEVQESILANPKYQRLKLTFSPELEVTTGAFNSGNKSEVYIQEAYKKAPRCAICGGLLHTHSISIDHIQRKRDGGLGCVENGQLTHPYCNTGVKN